MGHIYKSSIELIGSIGRSTRPGGFSERRPGGPRRHQALGRRRGALRDDLDGLQGAVGRRGALNVFVGNRGGED